MAPAVPGEPLALKRTRSQHRPSLGDNLIDDEYVDDDAGTDTLTIPRRRRAVYRVCTGTDFQPCPFTHSSSRL
jgi:hypothetical protein